MAELSLDTLVGIIGAGTMGAGIAHAYAAAGNRVVLVDNDPSALTAGVERIHRIRDRPTAPAGSPSPAGGPSWPMSRIVLSADLAVLASAGLVIEAVPEGPRLKSAVLADVEAVVSDSAVIATNTSSISIDELGAVLRVPQRFVGLHFFNPVPASLLVEIVCGKATSSEVVDAAVQLVHRIGKEAILVHDSPGFATSRLGVLLGIEAIRMVEEGVGSPEDIDKAMSLGYRHPIGPLRLTDLVGLDVRLAVADYLHVRLGERFEPPQLLRTMVGDGLLGRKSGRGFFRYESR